jgi:hypothetical protein
MDKGSMNIAFRVKTFHKDLEQALLGYFKAAEAECDVARLVADATYVRVHDELGRPLVVVIDGEIDIPKMARCLASGMMLPELSKLRDE